MSRTASTAAAAFALMAVLAAISAGATELPAAIREQLTSSTYVYIATQRKDGSFSKPAEIWFMYHDSAVWVGTPPTTWRVKRIKHRRPNAKIAVGKPDGPSFDAVGSIVKDAKVADLLFETYAKKYPDRWPGYTERFKNGMKDGSRVLVKYVPK
ncbi:MAG: hypothetical protein HY271_16125 [Deltaproteobacteria bacterium]|nr:hypothetical protein [Deltaproteobacteria bacterium]